MAIILQLETSTSTCSVALALDGKTVAFKELDERNAHAGHLTLFIEEVLQAAEKKMLDLDAVAVSMGPGSYTGLRIGVSTAKGLCYALDIPLLAINTLESMASGFKSTFKYETAFLCPMIDARRMEVYSAVYDNEIKEILPVAARIIDARSFAEILEKDKVVFFGDGAMKCEGTLSGFSNAAFIPDFVNSAKDMSELAYKKYILQQFEDVAYFEPFYLKDFLIIEPKSK